MSSVITDGLVEEVAQQAYRNSLVGSQPLRLHNSLTSSAVPKPGPST